MDADIQNPASADDETELGAILYFQLSMNNPIENLDFVIDSCVVKDTNLEEKYKIITNQCGDEFLEYTSSEVKADNVQSAINFSYQGFKFVASVDDETAIKTQPVTRDAQPGIHKEDLPISRTELHVTQQA